MIPLTRIEWLAVVFGLVMILVVLVYCGWRITAVNTMIATIESHLAAQDQHMHNQDAEAADRLENQITILKHQEVILDHITREEKLWPKAKP